MRAREVLSSYLPDGWVRGLGQPLAAGVAVGILVAAAAWYFIPIRSAALVRLRFPDEQWMEQQADSPYQSWLTSRSGQSDSVTNESVLTATLQQPGVLRLPSVVEADDPVVWLRKSIRAGFGREPDVVQIVISAGDPDEVLTLAEAFKKAYLGPFLSRQREKRLQHKETLEERRRQNQAEVQKRTLPADKPEIEIGQPLQPLQPPAGAESKLRGRVESLRTEVAKLGREIDDLKTRLAEADAVEPADQKAREQALIKRHLEATLAEDPALARGNSLAIALDAALYEERLRAVRADQPSVARLEDRLRAVRQRTGQRRERILPEVSLKLEKQIARGDIPALPVSLRVRIKRQQQLKTLLEQELKLAASMLGQPPTAENASEARGREQAASRTKIGRLKADTSELDRELAHIDVELAALGQVASRNQEQTPPVSSNADDRLLHLALAGLAAFLATAALVFQRTRSE